MKLGELNDWLQVVGLFGVIVSLIFVGLQLKQDRQFAQAEGITAAAESSKYWAELLTSNADVWTKGIAGDHLSDVEKQKFSALADAFFLRWQSAWMRAIQLNLGHPEESRFAQEAALFIYFNPGLQKYWAQRAQRVELLSQGDSNILTRNWVAAVDEQLELINSELDEKR